LRESIGGRVARSEQADPDAPVASSHQIVRISGQVIEQHPSLRRATSNIDVIRVPVDLPHAVLTCLVDELKRSAWQLTPTLPPPCPTTIEVLDQLFRGAFNPMSLKFRLVAAARSRR
jgi:hypothetical protein